MLAFVQLQRAIGEGTTLKRSQLVSPTLTRSGYVGYIAPTPGRYLEEVTHQSTGHERMMLEADSGY